MVSKQPNEYLHHYAAQVAVLGPNGQELLLASHVHISGLGRIGHQVAMNAVAAGIGLVSANDPQVMEPENFGAFAFARPSDLGREKAFVLERFFHGRPDFIFEPIVAPTESEEVDSYIARSDLVISCANTVSARLVAEAKAIRSKKPIIQVVSFDHREQIGGLVNLWMPHTNSACFGCLLGDGSDFPRGEGLLSTATATLAAIASNTAVQILTDTRADFLKQNNLFFVDLERYEIEPLFVERRTDCKICGVAT